MHRFWFILAPFFFLQHLISGENEIGFKVRQLQNPFLVDFKISKDHSFEELDAYQEALRYLKVYEILSQRYYAPENKRGFYQKSVKYDDFANRLHKGLWQTFIDLKGERFPVSKVVEINGGGSDCIVLFSSLDRVYPQHLLTLVEALKEVGFQGWVYYRLGGYPQPTNSELMYAGVPYAFKMFMMEEAKNLGFRYLLWLDSSLLPLKNPQPLFDLIREKGVVYKDVAPLPEFMLEQTRLDIQLLTGIDVLKCRHLRMPVFGIDTNLSWFPSFLKDHRDLVRIGTPFVSGLPEEFVLTALKEIYFAKDITPTPNLVGFHFVPAVAQKNYFYLRHH
ncbi:MAG: hypothetical protein FJZ62_05610 [Chlamydiae bacterium]|nr:hypothetical protein [Chlamydiota bacterium]